MPPERSNSNTPIGNSNNSQQSQQHTSFVPPEHDLAATSLFPKIPNILPHERVFPIQIGSELFKLSGASISSDGGCFAHITSHHIQMSLLISSHLNPGLN